MALTKKDREIIYNKYGGRCAYCGCILEKGWHADHLKPVRRKMKYCRNKGHHIATQDLRYPKRDCLDNYNPSCASCNINKHQMNLEEFRSLVAGFITSLNRDSTQYKIAKRYGFIKEVEMPVVFYFEKFTNPAIIEFSQEAFTRLNTSTG